MLHADMTIAISCATGVEQLHQLMQAAELKLSEADLRELDQAGVWSAS